MEELFKEGRDLTAAEKEFLEIFKNEDEKLRLKLLRNFIIGFKEKYRDTKKFYETVSIDILKDMEEHLKEVLGMLETLKAKKGTILLTAEAFWLGKALGIFLATIEYGITSIRRANTSIANPNITLNKS